MTPSAAAVLDRAVVVDLDVAWRPEQGQPAAQVRQQRDRVRAAQEEVLRTLGGHGRLRRALPETAQVALVVDEKGLALLRRSPLVAAVHDDVPDSTS